MTAKILSLILAFILWMYVMNEQNPLVEGTLTVPLEARNVAQGLLLIDTPESVRVKVRGPRSIVAGALPRDIKAYVDVKGLKEGRHSAAIYAQAPTSLELLGITPDKVTLRLDAAQERGLAVEIRLSGASPNAPVLAKATSNVTSASVEGPQTLVETVDKIVAVVDLTGKTADYTATVPLLALNREGKEVGGVGISPGKINVAVSVRGAVKKLVDIKPTVFGELEAGFSLRRITTEPEKIEISGDPDVLAHTEFVYTEPIGLTNIDRDSIRETKLLLREGVTAAQNEVKIHIAVERNR